MIWPRTLDEAADLSKRALTFGGEALPGARAFSEVPFGGSEPKSDVALPWDATKTVEIPWTGFKIAGYIDRLDVSGDSRQAMVRDYKTGRVPDDSIVVDGGKELQRCLYAFAVKALLGGDVEISASLLYSRAEVDLRLADAEGTLTQVIGYLNASFAYDVASDTFTPTQKDAKCGAACHEIAAAKDYIFHPYQHR